MTSLEYLLGKDLTYVCNVAQIEFESHSEAIRTVGEARLELSALLGDRERLTRALHRWGRHDATCALRSEPNLPGDARCACGFSQALEGLAS